MPTLHENVRDIVEIVGISLIVIVTVAKIVAMQMNTKRWNGLGRAIRLEKYAYLSLFLWLLLRKFWEGIDRSLIFLAIASFITFAEVRVLPMIPLVWIQHITGRAKRG